MAREGIKWRPSPNFDERGTGVSIDMLVLHYTGMATGEAAIERLCDPAAKVSAHYVIEEDGRIFSLVDEKMRAWHAGVSCWRGKSDINARSIGVEIVNPGHEFGYRSFPNDQMAAVKAVAVDIVGRHLIPARNVVGHSDVAPDRKEDPGELFDWRELSQIGVGLWYQDDLSSFQEFEPLAVGEEGTRICALRKALQEIGYGVSANGIYNTELENVIRAFQRHWRASRVDGIADPETQSIIYALLAEARRLT